MTMTTLGRDWPEAMAMRERKQLSSFMNQVR